MFGPGPTGGGRYDVAFRGTSGVASVESWVRAPVRTGLQTFGPAGAGAATKGTTAPGCGSPSVARINSGTS